MRVTTVTTTQIRQVDELSCRGHQANSLIRHQRSPMSTALAPRHPGPPTGHRGQAVIRCLFDFALLNRSRRSCEFVYFSSWDQYSSTDPASPYFSAPDKAFKCPDRKIQCP